MSNDLPWIHDGRDSCLSGLISWPFRPTASSLMAGLMAPVKHYPSIRESVEIVCLQSNHRGSYTRINPESSFLLMSAAKQSHNLFFRQDIEKQAAEQDIDIEHLSNRHG
ncbi:hypothetical protein CEP54_002011 [Fusarium duplospermum]|uniref:Uncharacterized protein n=1 Tax=Fusarium duplospermum TaxID=1325734 RepID=A0A428QXN8_9HYPO|nr:hypothetical protein CEP54_002011 [Fusarium duplospermum]